MAMRLEGTYGRSLIMLGHASVLPARSSFACQPKVYGLFSNVCPIIINFHYCFLFNAFSVRVCAFVCALPFLLYFILRGQHEMQCAAMRVFWPCKNQ